MNEGFVKDTVEDTIDDTAKIGEDTVQWRFCERYGRRYSICEDTVEDTVISQDLLMSSVLHCPHTTTPVSNHTPNLRTIPPRALGLTLTQKSLVKGRC